MNNSSEYFFGQLESWIHKYDKVLTAINEEQIDPDKVAKIRDKGYSLQSDIIAVTDELISYADKIETYIARLEAAIEDLDRRQGRG